MATYKVIQDIEAEDKFIGPLTLKQFIFAGAGLFFGYLCVFAITRGVPFLVALFAPPAMLGLFLAFPWSKEQPTEVWVLAKLRFRLKPKERIWDQAGHEELVTITAPKVIEKHLTNGLKPDEVQSRLKALATTIDSRGWAVKHVTLDEAYQPYVTQQAPSGQRLIDLSNMPQAVPDENVSQYPDVLDENNHVSNNFEQMIETSSANMRQEALDKMNRIRNGESLQAVQQPPINFMPPNIDYQQQYYPDEQAISQQLQANRANSNLANQHMRRIPDQESQEASQTPVRQPQAEMTKPVDPDIISAASNNDRTVESLARDMRKKRDEENEVVVSLR